MFPKFASWTPGRTWHQALWRHQLSSCIWGDPCRGLVWSSVCITPIYGHDIMRNIGGKWCSCSIIKLRAGNPFSDKLMPWCWKNTIQYSRRTMKFSNYKHMGSSIGQSPWRIRDMQQNSWDAELAQNDSLPNISEWKWFEWLNLWLRW